MKRLMIYSKHSGHKIIDILFFLKANSNIILLFVLFICGILIGCGIYAGSTNNSTSVLADSINSLLLNNNAKKIFINSILSSICLLLLSLCSGLCCVGFPMLYTIPLIKGIYYGLIASFMLYLYAMQGFSYFLLTVLPGAVISVSAIIVACNLSCEVTKSLAVNVFANGREEVKIKQYLIKYTFILAAMFIASILDYLSVQLFSKIFYMS